MTKKEIALESVGDQLRVILSAAQDAVKTLEEVEEEKNPDLGRVLLLRQHSDELAKEVRNLHWWIARMVVWYQVGE